MAIGRRADETGQREPQGSGTGEDRAVGGQGHHDRAQGRTSRGHRANPYPPPLLGWRRDLGAVAGVAVRRPPPGLLRRSRATRGRRAVPGERDPRPRHPARAARGGGRALPPVRRPLADQRPQPRPAGRRPSGPGGCRHRPARLLGQPQLGPLPHRRARRDGARRRHPGGLLRHQRLLVVVELPAVPREPLRRRRPARARAPRGSTSCGTTSTTPGWWSPWSRRWSRRWTELPERRAATAPTWSS